MTTTANFCVVNDNCMTTFERREFIQPKYILEIIKTLFLLCLVINKYPFNSFVSKSRWEVPIIVKIVDLFFQIFFLYQR